MKWQKLLKPGIKTDAIDKVCYEYINDHGAYSAPLFYRGFPKSCCTSQITLFVMEYLLKKF